MPLTKPPFRFSARVVRVIDGDTVEAEVLLLPGLTLTTKLRLAGVNCPEVGTDAGVAAKRWVENLLPAGTPVVAELLRQDKFGGRWDAKVWTSDGPDLGALLVAAGHAVVVAYQVPPDEEETLG